MIYIKTSDIHIYFLTYIIQIKALHSLGEFLLDSCLARGIALVSLIAHDSAAFRVFFLRKVKLLLLLFFNAPTSSSF